MINDALSVIGATAMKNAVTHFSLHTTGAVTSSTNESTAARVAVSGSVDADGDITWTGPYNFTGGAANGPVARVGYWSASTAGTYYGGFLITAPSDTTFNSAGEYTVTSGTETSAFS